MGIGSVATQNRVFVVCLIKGCNTEVFPTTIAILPSIFCRSSIVLDTMKACTSDTGFLFRWQGIFCGDEQHLCSTESPVNDGPWRPIGVAVQQQHGRLSHESITLAVASKRLKQKTKMERHTAILRWSEFITA